MMPGLKDYDIKDIPSTRAYIPYEVDKVLAEKDKEIAELKADYKEACDRLQTANLIKDEQKAKADELLMKISGLEKLVETADKILKEKGGFTIKDMKFNGVKIEGVKND